MTDRDSPSPRGEYRRLAALYALDQLDRPPEERFDRLTRLARRLFLVDTAAITLVDAERQYFRAITGLDLRQGPREGSFCNVCTRRRKPLVVEDASQDPEFAESEYVTKPPYVRFYAGVPLAAPDGSLIATLCIFSPEPREFSDDDLEALKDLAALAAAELNVSWWSHHASQQEERAFESQIDRRRAEQTTHAKTQFLAHMSHEIRTPLNGVLGMLQLLESGELTDEQALQIRIARSSGEHLLRLIDDALDLSRMEIGEIRLQPEACDLARLGKDVVNLVQSAATGARSPDFRLEIDGALPSHAMLDLLRVKQVLINLLNNAAKFTAHGFVALRLGLQSGSEEGGPRLVFEVEDTGRGMAPDQLARVFKPFVQIEAEGEAVVPGSGLGLAITRRLVATMGGKIQVRSQPGEGTVFTVSLPLLPATPQDVASSDPLVTDARTGPLRVLLVDDDNISAKVATAFLEREGHQVQRAVSGREALERLREGGFDLTLMDIGLPDIDGMQVTIMAREQIPDVPPIIALTAFARQEDRKAFLAAGMAAHLQKPVHADSLMRTIAQVLSRVAVAGKDIVTWDVRLLCERLQQDERLLRDLLAGFMEDLPGLLSAMDDAIHAGDRMGLVRLAHRLRGQFGNLCVETCEDQARELEYEALGAAIGTIEISLRRLRQSIDAVLPEFQAVLSAPEGTPICGGGHNTERPTEG